MATLDAGVEGAWARIVAWCAANAPATFEHLRPALPAAERAAVEQRFRRDWPQQLRDWYALMDGVHWESANTPLPDWRILSSADMVDRAEMLESIYGSSGEYAEQDPDGPQLIAEGEAAEAGSLAFIWLPSFVPIGENIAACFLYVDTRPGPRSGCVAQLDRDEGAISEPVWESVAAMLADVADALESGRECDGWSPVVDDGALAWTPA